MTALLLLALAAGSAALVADRLAPWAGVLAHRLGCVARANPDVPTHVRTVPLLGGVAILGGLAPWIAAAVAGDPRWWALVAALVPMVALGAYKDRVGRPVAPAAQLVVQAGAAACLWLGGFRIGAPLAALDAAATIALALAVINAWNYVDVLDGLAAGIAAAAAIVFLPGDREAAGIAAGLAGASLGYLRHNRPPARIFMGDIGSFVIGVTFAALALDAIGGRARGAASLLAMLVPLGDLAVTTAARLAAGTSPLAGGPEHLPLRLLARGWTTARIDLAAAALTLAAVAIAWLVMA